MFTRGYNIDKPGVLGLFKVIWLICQMGHSLLGETIGDIYFLFLKRSQGCSILFIEYPFIVISRLLFP